ncbi:MAG: hypothetical protein CBD07_001260 [Flavobacteriaceae bacterium TMED147]|nr:MAG: hypothetical protein CBD07_001260 [Flavobacteriaceae bacterium TMED147]
MKKSITALLCILLSSCFKTDIRQYETWNLDPFTKVSGYQVNRLPRQYNVFNAGIFLNKYDETMWADTDNYYSDFSDIKFEFHGPVFISFFNIDNEVSYCKGWKKDENIYDGIKWNITFKRAEEDVLWFDIDYYGTSQEIEYTISYKYEVIDSLLYFSRTKIKKNNPEDLVDTSEIDETFIFSPSEKNYSKDLVDTGEIIVSEGCMFY